MIYVACAVLLVSVVASLSAARRDLNQDEKAQLHLIAIVAALWAILAVLIAIYYQSR